MRRFQNRPKCDKRNDNFSFYENYIIVKTYSLLRTCTLIALAICSLPAPPASAQGFGGDISGVSDFLRFLPPVITSVKHYPSEPAPDQEVTVKARVGRISLGEDYEYVEAVILYYSADNGETWEEIYMEEDDSGLNWTEYIPGLPEGTEVVYHVKAVDSVGNIAQELPPADSMKVEWFDLLDAGEDEGEIPHDYLVHLYDHENAPGIEVPDYFDVLSVSFGYDEYSYYFRIEFEGPVKEGSITPLDANAYAFLLINKSLVLSPKIMKSLREYGERGEVDESAIEENKGELMKIAESLWLWLYMPLAEIAPPIDGIGKLPGVSLAHIDPEAGGCPLQGGGDLRELGRAGMRALKCIRFEPEGWSYELRGNYLDLTLDREMLGPAGNDTINFIIGNGRAVGPDLMNAEFLKGDISYSAGVIMREHWYEVGP